jgi:ketosteroid isomerase-like protein
LSTDVPRRRRHGQSKAAVEGRNAQALADMYADNAVMLVIDRDNPPSNPRRLSGKAAISSYFGDVVAT